MAQKIVWTRTLSEVLQRATEKKNFKSKKGTDYETDCIPRIDLIVIGSPIERKDETGATTGYSYEVYDNKTDTTFHITAPQLIEGSSFKTVAFLEVRGGALAGKGEGWFSASRVAPLKKQGE